MQRAQASDHDDRRDEEQRFVRLRRRDDFLRDQLDPRPRSAAAGRAAQRGSDRCECGTSRSACAPNSVRYATIRRIGTTIATIFTSDHTTGHAAPSVWLPIVVIASITALQRIGPNIGPSVAVDSMCSGNVHGAIGNALVELALRAGRTHRPAAVRAPCPALTPSDCRCAAIRARLRRPRIVRSPATATSGARSRR